MPSGIHNPRRAAAVTHVSTIPARAAATRYGSAPGSATHPRPAVIRAPSARRPSIVRRECPASRRSRRRARPSRVVTVRSAAAREEELICTACRAARSPEHAVRASVDTFGPHRTVEASLRILLPRLFTACPRAPKEEMCRAEGGCRGIHPRASRSPRTVRGGREGQRATWWTGRARRLAPRAVRIACPVSARVRTEEMYRAEGGRRGIHLMGAHLLVRSAVRSAVRGVATAEITRDNSPAPTP